MRVLLVDDSRTMRTIQKNALKAMGFEDIDEASDGLEALKCVEQESPGLILLDWNMPNMDGMTFLKEFRANNKATPVVMVTTEAEKSRVIEAIKAGVNNYIVKPFTPEDFNSRITETLAKRKAG